MKFPGENTITLSIPALLQLVEDRLRLEMGHGIRVLEVCESTYRRTYTVTITTDPAPDAITTDPAPDATTTETTP